MKPDNAEKRAAFLSSVEVFNVNTGCWEQRATRGTPPLGVWGYSCVAVRDDLYYFGGLCDGDLCHYGKYCLYNSVHTLSTSTLQWRTLSPTTSEDGAPMKKSHCGVVHFTVEEEDLLFVVGGFASCQEKAQCRQNERPARTDEQHVFSLSTSECTLPTIASIVKFLMDGISMLGAYTNNFKGVSSVSLKSRGSGEAAPRCCRVYSFSDSFRCHFLCFITQFIWLLRQHAYVGSTYSSVWLLWLEYLDL